MLVMEVTANAHGPCPVVLSRRLPPREPPASAHSPRPGARQGALLSRGGGDPPGEAVQGRTKLVRVAGQARAAGGVRELGRVMIRLLRDLLLTAEEAAYVWLAA